MNAIATATGAAASIREIAEALGVSLSQGNRRASKGAWPFTEATLPAGGKQRLYPLTTLPRDVRAPVENRRNRALLANASPAPMPAPVRAADLKDWQRTPAQARAVLLAEIDRLVVTGSSQGRAINALVEGARAGTLSAELMAMVRAANARSNAARTLTRATLYNWLKARETAPGTDPLAVLAPAGGKEAPRPAWADTLLKLWQRPFKPMLTECLDDHHWPPGMPKPSYGQARGFLKKQDPITLAMGRLGPKLLKGKKAFLARDVSYLSVGSVFIGDGHTFKATVAHPIHGGPFRPEITVFLDVYSRRWVGWSMALAENTWSVADALRHAVTTTTCCDAVYYDNGSGAKNRTWDDEATGLIARLSITKEHSAPWSSQARGAVERFHSTVLHRLARRFRTYVGERMDQETVHRVNKAVKADVKVTGTSRLLPTWGELLALLQQAQDEYNARPHSFLPRIIDPETGRRRHMSPMEVWDQAVADGWRPEPVPADEAVELFRPAERRTVRRAQVSLFGNDYFAMELERLHGTEVMVGYDLRDASKVWVRQLDGSFICEAIWGGNRTSYRPVPKLQRDHEKRVEGRLRRVKNRENEVLLERGPGVIDHQPAAIDADFTRIEAEQLAIGAQETARLLAAPAEPDPAGDDRPTFFEDAEWARWLAAHPDRAEPGDAQALGAKLRNPTFRMLMSQLEIDLSTLQAIANAEAA